MKFDYTPGQTPLDPDETEGLIPRHITIQKQLNEWEQQNIITAEIWAFSKKRLHLEILTHDFLQKVHKKMFNKTWRWAGKFRQTLKTIGPEPYKITTELKDLFEDAIYQINHQIYSIDEIAYRFHHRLVKIHPFPNGNGRHARLMTDMLLHSLKQPRFNWGSQQLIEIEPIRKQYIKALKMADKGDYTNLAKFVRS
jgi:Fic-DOC domain mobile mystery protein B